MNIRRGTLYLADLKIRRSTEPAKIRPVLVIQMDWLNELEHPSVLILPCTTRLEGENRLRVQVPKGTAGNSRDCEIMIDQGRAIDNRCFVKSLHPLPEDVLQEVDEKLKYANEL